MAKSAAVLTHGAHPVLVSHVVKQALLDVAAATGNAPTQPQTREGWASLAHDLGVRAIHIAEGDTPTTRRRKALGGFANIWSVHGFVGEGRQPAELGWGGHERTLPPQAQPGAAARVRTWWPQG